MGREGVEPTRGITPADFHATLAFAILSFEIRSLDFPLTLAICLRSRPSSLYTFFFFIKKLGSGLPFRDDDFVTLTS